MIDNGEKMAMLFVTVLIILTVFAVIVKDLKDNLKCKEDIDYISKNEEESVKDKLIRYEWERNKKVRKDEVEK